MPPIPKFAQVLAKRAKAKPKVKNEIINLIENHGVTTFYNGGKGKFDWLCAKCVKDLKSDYPFIKSYLILAYIPTNKEKSDINRYDDFDDTIYPNLETIPPKYAIIKHRPSCQPDTFRGTDASSPSRARHPS